MGLLSLAVLIKELGKQGVRIIVSRAAAARHRGAFADRW
jgi:hypothetical protein